MPESIKTLRLLSRHLIFRQAELFFFLVFYFFFYGYARVLRHTWHTTTNRHHTYMYYTFGCDRTTLLNRKLQLRPTLPNDSVPSGSLSLTQPHAAKHESLHNATT